MLTSTQRLRRLALIRPEYPAPELPPPPPPSLFLRVDPYKVKPVQTTLPFPSNVNMVAGVLESTHGGYPMGEQVDIRVSWEEVQPADGLHQHGELWIRVLSQKPMEATLVVPQEVVDQLSPEMLESYNHRTVCNWQADLREDDDETVIEWPYEQWWALPKMKVIA